MKTVFSGIQPTGKVHLGNLLGAINNWVHLSNEENKNYFCVVDLHSLTTHPDPSLMQENINETIKVLISSGINQKNSNIYIQSNVPEHVQLSWILSNFCQIGELQRMTQFKEKADQLGSHAGILTYPGARLMSLRHPDNKMSKSKDDLNGTIYFDDSKDEIIKKFKSSVTDSENEIKFDNETKKGISNLIDIYSTLHELTHADVENKFKNSSYGEFKIEVGESVVSYLEPIKERYDSLSEGDVASLIKDNLDDVKNSAKKTMDEVSAVVGV
jgi:tryptophanyl-tRNA synthetase